MTERKFNHDIRLSPQDRDFAIRNWPSVGHALVNEPLIGAFTPFEADAKRNKETVQWLGTVAIALTIVALCGAVLEVWSSGQPKHVVTPTGVSLIAVSGVIGLLVAVLASRYGPFRRTWLKNRFVTECFRCWHFRQLQDAVAIESSTQSGATREKYVSERDARFDAFEKDLNGSVGQKMDLLREAGDDPIPDLASPRSPAGSAIVAELFDAYRALRLEHQLEFFVYKVSPDDTTFTGISLSALRSLTDRIAAASLTIATALAAVVALKPEWSLPLFASELAIVGVGVRAWRDGLALKAEQEHYRDMRDRFITLKRRWDGALDVDTRFGIMAEVERNAIEELRSFLRIHEHAQFIL